MMNMRKIRTSIVVLLLVILSGAFFAFKGKRYEVVIPQEKIDEALAEYFPASKNYLMILEITYSNPQVLLLEEENRIQVGMDATLNVRVNDEPQQLGGGATVTAGLRYEYETQEFFLDDVTFDRLEIQGIPAKWLDQVRTFGAEAAEEFVKRHPVYRLRAKDMKTAAAKALLKDFQVRGQAIHVTLGY